MVARVFWGTLGGFGVGRSFVHLDISYADLKCSTTVGTGGFRNGFVWIISERESKRVREREMSTLRSLALSHNRTSCHILPTALAIPPCICCGSDFKAELRDARYLGLSKLLKNNNWSLKFHQLSGSAPWKH